MSRLERSNGERMAPYWLLIKKTKPSKKSLKAERALSVCRQQLGLDYHLKLAGVTSGCCHAACRMPSEQKEGCKQEQAPRPSPSPGSPRESLVLVWPGPLVVSYPACSFWSCRGAAHCVLGNSKLLPSLCRILGIPSHAPRIRPKGGFVPEQPSSGRRSDQRLLSFLGRVGWVQWDRGARDVPGVDGGGVALDHLTSHRLIDGT